MAAARCPTPTRGLATICGVALAVAAILPSSAGATTTCEYNGGAEVLNVKMSSTGDVAQFALEQPGGEVIQVRGGGPVLVCAGGTPTTANTESVNVFDESANGDTFVSIIQAPAFQPTTDFILAMGGGIFDRLLLQGTAGIDNIFIGANGVDVDGNGSKDISFIGAPDQYAIDGAAGNDSISAQGSASTGAAMSTFVEISGDEDNDTINGGEGGDGLEGGPGDDVVHGRGGNDGLGTHVVVPGNDTLDGGPGEDTVSFSIAQNPLTVDLGKTLPQQTGDGEDAFIGVENLEGTGFNDSLIGDAGPNRLFGGAGNDMLDGRGGDDELEGSIGTDTLSYGSAPGGVAVNLETGAVTGAAGVDTAKNFEDLIGSPFADTLTGSSLANTITAGGGIDTVRALGGPDLVNVRDGGHDDAGCGSGSDRAVADRLSVDTVQPDCEQVDALPEPPGGGKPSDTSLVLQLSARRRQRVLKQRAVVVKVGCPQEACTIAATVAGAPPKPKAVTRRLQAGPASTLRLHLSRKQRRAIRARLLAGERPRIRVTVKAGDAAGNVATRSIAVTTKR